MHSLGICGEPHVKLLDFIPFYSYLTEYRVALAYTLKNTWQHLNIF